MSGQWTCDTVRCQNKFTPTAKEIELKQDADTVRHFFCDPCRKKMVDDRVLGKMGYVRK